MIKIMFKYGDDLRQDNLVLQFFRIMDEMWMEKNENMEMVRYKVMETGFQVGFIEFVDHSEVIAGIHKWRGTYEGPFQKKCIYEFFKQEIYPKHFKDQLTLILKKEKDAKLEKMKKIDDSQTQDNKIKDFEKVLPTEEQIFQALQKTDEVMHKMMKNYIRSLAGQCVATYLLGIRDRHSGNFMLQKTTSKFFHIDFGHFLDHCKYKLKFFKRDREPFIYSYELNYLMVNFPRIFKDFKQDPNQTLPSKVKKKVLDEGNGEVVKEENQGGVGDEENLNE